MHSIARARDIIIGLTLLSVLIPLYNEEELVGALMERVLKVNLPEGVDSELIVVDDGSSDESVSVVSALSKNYPGRIRLIRHERNQGKGAAIRTAIQHAKGDIGIIQDADLEYTPTSTLVF